MRLGSLYLMWCYYYFHYYYFTSNTVLCDLVNDCNVVLHRYHKESVSLRRWERNAVATANF